MVFVTDFVSPAEEEALVAWFGLGVVHPSRIGLPPTDRYSRSRVARYGPGIDVTHYCSGERDPVMPPILAALAHRLVERELVPPAELPNAITVNEYRVGQGIPYHTDVAHAGTIISTLALWGDATLSMKMRDRHGPTRHDLPFPRRSLYQFTGVSRRPPWQHAILPVREHRLSVVFRCGKL